MAVVVDTSVLIDCLRGSSQALAVLRAATERGDTLMASVLTKIEVLAGMRAGEEQQTRALLGVMHWIEVDDPLAERAGSLANQFGKSHPGVDPVDYVIAATAQQLDAPLVTRNIKHFPMFPKLRPPY
jgi:predicted nucleic acid-binding protein